MLKKLSALAMMLMIMAPAVLADQTSDQDYVNKLRYRNGKMSIDTKKRTINEYTSYQNVDIDTNTYYYDNSTSRSTNISSNALSRSEAKEITEWYIYKGPIAQLSDFEFLDLVGDKSTLVRITEQENKKAGFRTIGNVTIGVGLAGMLGGAAFQASSSTVAASALVMVAGFFFNAFNQSPAHYIRADYAQDKIIEYNVNLKKSLNLPLTYE